MKTATDSLFSHYPYVLHYDQTFISGWNQGQTISGSLHFVSPESAELWIKGIKKHFRRNGYKISNCRLVENKKD